jgi:predicted alpha/beta superfamily hydrolase
MKKGIIISVLLFIWSIHSFCQIKLNHPLRIEKYITENGERLIMKSEILNEEKEIYIGLPDHYNDTTGYPLILVLEGEVIFETFAPVTRLMGQLNEIPPCIVAGIPFYEKHLDYAPKISGHPESGNADKMLDFYRFELFPLMDSLYHCTEDRLIWAHSALGAIFCTYLLLGPDTQFTGILSSSPNLRWMQDYVKKDHAFEEVAKKGKLFYYLTFGSNEGENSMGEMFQNVLDFKTRLENEAPENLIWKYQLNENNNHFTNAIETYIDGLILYFKYMK